ncbi:MAG: MBL fold metallo-hydrolase, partial [Candidatus Promineifilaceae bacterium]|nr:MBL fold metallo-hydrolase [Candidatus Promineifilaceae bacterium]
DERRLRPPAGILLTHAHMGHVGGLMHLGNEAMAVRDLPVYASPGLVGTLQRSALWQPLLARLRLIPLHAAEPLALAEDLTVTPLPVPHRDELGTETFAFLITGPSRRLLYLPDIDSWAGWREARRHLQGVDVAFVDATFASPDEIGRQATVAHPTLQETLSFFAGWPGELWLTHLNHTNPLLDPGSAAARAVAAAGRGVARRGQTIPL